MHRLVPLVAGFYRELAGASEPISITYRQAHGAAFRMPAVEGEFAAPDPADLALAVARALAATRQQERFRGVTLAGPHRDDIELTIGGQDSRLYASQGQQRSMALALRLAESELLRAVLDERPVLLLDDVFSELDQRRRDALLALLGLGQGGRQTFITATDLSGIPLRELGAAAEFQVRDGEVRRLA